MYPSPGVIERIGPNWDWIWIDAQHGDLDYRETVTLIRAANLIGKPVLVRPPGQDTGWISRVLDAGAAGVIVPMIESLEEAKAMIQAAKFPPEGNRSYGGRRIIDLLGRTYYKTANRDTVLILQLESDDAVAKAEQLAALEGVDGLFLGPDDLLIRSGQEVETPKNPETIGRQNKAVADACQKYEKLGAGIGVAGPMMQMAKDYGFDLIVGGGDVPFLVGGSKKSADEIRAFFADSTQSNDAVGPSTLY